MKENISIGEHILQVLAEKNPETIEQLVKLVRQKSDFSEKQILKCILSLQSEGKIKLEGASPAAKSSTCSIIISKIYWYLTTLIFTGITVFLVLQVPENAYPVVYVRYFFGSFFVFLMPGYALIRALYPAKRLGSLERIGLSICMSIALVCLDAFLLNFSPWKITVLSLILSLSLMTAMTAVIAVLREGRMDLRNQ